MAGDEARALVIGSHDDVGRVFDIPGKAINVEVLEPGTMSPVSGFDVVVLPGCLVCSVARDDRSADDLSPGTLLRQAYDALRPGGVVVGHLDHLLSLHGLRRTLRGQLPWAVWSRSHRLMSGPRCLRALDRSGFIESECFYVEPQLASAKALVPLHALAARGHFLRTIRRARGQYSNIGFGLRMTLAGVHLGRLLQPQLFFWARRPC